MAASPRFHCAAKEYGACFCTGEEEECHLEASGGSVASKGGDNPARRRRCAETARCRLDAHQTATVCGLALSTRICQCSEDVLRHVCYSMVPVYRHVCLCSSAPCRSLVTAPHSQFGDAQGVCQGHWVEFAVGSGTRLIALVLETIDQGDRS